MFPSIFQSLDLIIDQLHVTAKLCVHNEFIIEFRYDSHHGNCANWLKYIHKYDALNGQLYQ